MKKYYNKLGCPRCGARKDPNSRTYGVYIVKYNNADSLKLKCRCCGYIITFKVSDMVYKKDHYCKLKENEVK